MKPMAAARPEPSSSTSDGVVRNRAGLCHLLNVKVPDDDMANIVTVITGRSQSVQNFNCIKNAVDRSYALVDSGQVYAV